MGALALGDTHELAWRRGACGTDLVGTSALAWGMKPEAPKRELASSGLFLLKGHFPLPTCPKKAAGSRESHLGFGIRCGLRPVSDLSLSCDHTGSLHP